MATETIHSWSFTTGMGQGLVCDISVIVKGSQGYSGQTGNDPWAASVYLDGNLLDSASGAGFGSDQWSLLGGMIGVAAGSHTIEVKWYGSNVITLRNCNMRIDGRYF